MDCANSRVVTDPISRRAGHCDTRLTSDVMRYGMKGTKYTIVTGVLI